MSALVFSPSRLPFSCRDAIVAVGLAIVLSQSVQAALFQQLDASVGGSFLDDGGTLTWLDQSGNGRDAMDTSAGSGSVSLSTDPSLFPTGFDSVRFDGANYANYGRLDLFDSTTSDAVLDQSGANPAGFSLFVVARGDTNPVTGGWNDLIGNTTDVLDGSFLMRYNYSNGRFQGSVGGLTVQNNTAAEDNYNNGSAYVMGFNYDPTQVHGEITLASSLNSYSQIFNLSNSVVNRDFSNNDPFTLGKAFDTVSRLFVGNVGEVRIYDAALTAQQFADELEDLDQKWNASPDGRLDLFVDRATGNITLDSPGTIDIDLVGLRLRSASGSLDASDWLSITDNYDSNSGDRSVDGDDTWLKLSEKAIDLSEATLGTTTITAGQTIDLGNSFMLGGTEDILAEYADPVSQDALPVQVKYINQPPAGLLPGDFNNSGTVGGADFLVWQQSFGSAIALPNETVSNGRASAEDLGTWQANFNAGNLAAIESVPEPGGLLLGVCSFAAFAVCARYRLAKGSVDSDLALLLLAAFVAFAGVPQDATALDATVGAYYYPWWDTHDWDTTLRAHMTPEDQRPAAGYSDSSDADLISEHINQSHRGNISLWATSWWGPGSLEDNVLQQNILTHPRAGELDYAVHYESTGRFGSSSSPDFSNLVPDFQYLADHVFSDPNYFRIDNRPVVFMYVSRAYFSNPAAQQALASARQSLLSTHGYDPYVVGDEVFGSSFNASRAQHFDAVTTYDVYAMSGMKNAPVSLGDVSTAASKYAAAAAAGATVIPGVAPGYNDKAVRDGNSATGRYFTGETIGQAGSVFSALIDQAAGPNVDSSTDNLLLVNSFNEWHEDTQIEPTVVTGASSTDDSASGIDFTTGKSYEGYGNKYLDLLRAGTTEGGPTLLDGDADFDGNLDNDDIVAFAAAWGQENLVEGVRVGGYDSRISMPDFNYDGVVDFEDWFVMRATHAAAGSMSLADLIAVPEPSGCLLAIVGGWVFLSIRSCPFVRPGRISERF